ncbi:MAG: hypothetical protein QY318_01470 [Candidatus Dojkabacteria bacterium]|nr:MAG: hypothetical protein QY318_01470 [Candidatus Dojkabacteria bacterium]
MDPKYLEQGGNVHLAYYLEAADQLGIKYDVIIRSLTARMEKDGKIWFMMNASVPINGEPSSTLSRIKSYTYKVFQHAGIPVAEQAELFSEQDALGFFNQYKNIVIKPVRNIGGTGITILPQSEDEVRQAYVLARDKNMASTKVEALAERFAIGSNYRLLVLGDEVIGAVHRRPAHVTGDGVSTVAQLVEAKNAARKAELMKPIKLDAQSMLKLRSNGFTEGYVPQAGEEVELRFNSNLSTGGTTEECMSRIHPSYLDLAIRATKELGLKLGGVDLIAEDVTTPGAAAVINEINTNPGLRVHYKVDKGEVVPVATKILSYIVANI